MFSPGWSIAFRPYAWLWLLVACAVGVLAWHTYRHTVPLISPARRRVLLALRIAAIALLALAVTGPRVVWRGTQPRRPRVTVLVDQSESLSFADPYGRRPDVVRRVLSGDGMDRIRDEAAVTWQGFSDRTTPLDPDRLSFAGDASAIGDALFEQRRRMPPPDAVILVTDGANTTGPDPVRAAGEIGLSVYVVGVGDPRPQPDLRIVGVTAPEIAFAGLPMKVTATIENTALAPRTVAVRVVSGPNALARREVKLPPPGGRADVDLVVTPAAPGTLRGLVTVDGIPGEILAQNNLRPFTAQVLKAKRRVLILAGAPSADVAFWMRYLRGREDFAPQLWLAPHPAHPAAAPPLSPADLAATDLIIWHDMPGDALGRDGLAALMRAVGHGAGLLVVPGHGALPREWQPMLPVQAGRGRFVIQDVQPTWAPGADRHPILSGDANFPVWSAGWNTLPPLLGRTGDIVALPSGMTLLVAPGGPLAVAGTYDRGRVLVFAGLTYWRWDMVPRGLGDEPSPADAFWDDAVEWLGTRQELSRVRLQADAPQYRLGEPVRLVAQVYDAHYAPLDGADVRIEIDHGAEALTAVSEGDGRYVADVAGLEPGEHRATATATGPDASGNEVAIGRATVGFSIAVVGLEHEETRQQAEALAAVARASGGGYAPAAAADSLLRAIPLVSAMEERARTIAIGSSGWVLWTIIGLLTIEWVARRLRGLL